MLALKEGVAELVPFALREEDLDLVLLPLLESVTDTLKEGVADQVTLALKEPDLLLVSLEDSAEDSL